MNLILLILLPEHKRRDVRRYVPFFFDLAAALRSSLTYCCANASRLLFTKILAGAGVMRSRRGNGQRAARAYVTVLLCHCCCARGTAKTHHAIEALGCRATRSHQQRATNGCHEPQRRARVLINQGQGTTHRTMPVMNAPHSSGAYLRSPDDASEPPPAPLIFSMNKSIFSRRKAAVGCKM